MFILRHKYGKVLFGELNEIVRLAGVKEVNRQLVVDNVVYHSFDSSWSKDSLYNMITYDGLLKLKSNHGWSLFKEVL